jgi:hypothetical protein
MIGFGRICKQQIPRVTLIPLEPIPLRVVNPRELSEKIQNDLLTWAGDKNLSEDDKTAMCQIVVDIFKKEEQLC